MPRLDGIAADHADKGTLAAHPRGRAHSLAEELRPSGRSQRVRTQRCVCARAPRSAVHLGAIQLARLHAQRRSTLISEHGRVQTCNLLVVPGVLSRRLLHGVEIGESDATAQAGPAEAVPGVPSGAAPRAPRFDRAAPAARDRPPQDVMLTRVNGYACDSVLGSMVRSRSATFSSSFFQQISRVKHCVCAWPGPEHLGWVTATRIASQRDGERAAEPYVMLIGGAVLTGLRPRRQPFAIRYNTRRRLRDEPERGVPARPSSRSTTHEARHRHDRTCSVERQARGSWYAVGASRSNSPGRSSRSRR